MKAWKSFTAELAFARSRRRAQFRSIWAAMRRRRTGDFYCELKASEEYAVMLNDIEMLDVEGRVRRLPALPNSLKAIWIKSYERFGRVAEFDDPFSIRIENGRLVLEGGMRELMRLELQRESGETTVVARVIPPRSTGEPIDCSERFPVRNRNEQAAC
jgi:hypothetical protein